MHELLQRVCKNLSRSYVKYISTPFRQHELVIFNIPDSSGIAEQCMCGSMRSKESILIGLKKEEVTRIVNDAKSIISSFLTYLGAVFLGRLGVSENKINWLGVKSLAKCHAYLMCNATHRSLRGCFYP